MGNDQIQVSRTVDAEPAALFAVLATPDRHQEIDGAEMLRGVEGQSEPISGTGDAFVMRMHNAVLGDYQMRNTVVTYDEGREIAWAPELHPLDGYTDKLGDMRATGHRFIWRFEPAGPGRTTVTQTYDWSGVQDKAFRGLFPMLDEAQLGESIERAARAAG